METDRRRRKRRSGAPVGAIVGIAVAIVVVVAVVAFVLVGRAKKPNAPASAQASTTSAAVVAVTKKPAATGAATSSEATAPAKPKKGQIAALPTPWRDADPSWMDKYKGKLVLGFKPEPGYKAIALTFDDGPNGETQYIINELNKVGGQATFFDTGRKLAMSWAKTQPSLIWNQGFELGNHTQHHTLPDGVSSMWHRTKAIDLAEIAGPDAYYKPASGRNSVWLRPMGGMIDQTGVDAAASTDHLVINWTIDSNDSHGGTKTSDYIYNTVVSGAKSGDVVLLHVTHPESMAALPKIVAELDRRGFKLVTLSELAQHSTEAITQHIPK